MLHREEMPVHLLVAPWWVAVEKPNVGGIPAMREALALASLEELRIKTLAGISWDPFSDTRILWAAQYLNHQEDRSYRILPGIRTAASWHFASPFSPCGKDRSVGST